MPIKLVLSSNDPLSLPADLLVVGVPEGDASRNRTVSGLAKAIGPSVGKGLRRDEFTGKKDQSHEIVTNGAVKPARVLLVGLGKATPTDSDVRVLAAKGARAALGAHATSVAMVVPAVPGAERAAAEGIVLGAYRFTRYLTGDRVPKTWIDRGTIVVEGKVSRDARDAVATGQAVAEAICIARDLINEPPNELYPAALADAAVAVCKERGLEVTVFDKKQLEKRGMKLILAVAQGSSRDPRLVHMTYKPETPTKKKLVFVGKGLTFDSGGLCIKPAPGMEEMKGDMGGAANVIALMAAVAATKPNAEVHGIIGCAENMPDGNAYRPGDIFGSFDGKTVEIINTDAEGRLVLADALAYGRALNPDVMLDNATLTGACIIALGPTVSAFYANRDELADRFGKAARAAGEAMWHMPLVEDLRDGLKSDWADIKHVADRWGGSITAALFLRDFVGDVPWIHVDIAGPSMANKPYNVYAKGGTGHGVLTYLKLIEDVAAST
ncbi:MAG TPA: leucyl aminopeptidase [Minicystis sp.]|nr:leucyl aminopeptidase [Minicystis sp.]